MPRPVSVVLLAKASHIFILTGAADFYLQLQIFVSARLSTLEIFRLPGKIVLWGCDGSSQHVETINVFKKRVITISTTARNRLGLFLQLPLDRFAFEIEIKKRILKLAWVFQEQFSGIPLMLAFENVLFKITFSSCQDLNPWTSAWLVGAHLL